VNFGTTRCHNPIRIGTLFADLFLHCISAFLERSKQKGSELMSTTTTIQPHIAYELIDDHNPDVVVIEFLSQEIAGTCHARELGEQLDSLIRPDFPHNFVIDFGNVRLLGSTAFAEIVSFAHKVVRLCVCNMQENLRLGAALIGLDDCADFAANRRLAISETRRAAIHDEDDTVDYPASWLESNEAPAHASRSA
jgi:anti-anti-sigma regulatory factor